MNTVVALELISTGPDPFQDSIVDVAAAVWADGALSQCTGELVRPVRPPPAAFFARRPELSPGMLDQARSHDEVLAELLQFLPDAATCISHHADRVKPFLQAATHDRFLRPVLDTCELSKICLPDLARHTLPDLLEALRLPPAAGRFSLAACEDTLRVWQHLVRSVRAWPAALRDEVNRILDDMPHHPLQTFFRQAAADPPGPAESDGRAVQRFADLFIPAAKPPPPRRDVPGPEEWTPLDEDEVLAPLEREGDFARKLDGYEFRRQQLDMARAVVRAFNDATHLMVEAGTGIGKSLAYLLPAVQWAVSNRVPVVISTNTKNLQSQLFTKDLPLIANTLGLEFAPALIKGRRNYLCIRKLLYLLKHADSELNRDDRPRLLRVLVWAAQTTTGDMSESAPLQEPGAPRLLDQLSSSVEECPGSACRHRGHCFLYRARALSLAADIVVANHSVVFAEMDNAEAGAALPPYAHLVFDEAHNIEDAATNWLSAELSFIRIRFILGRLLRSGRRNKASGLLPTLRRELAQAVAAGKDVPETLPPIVEQTIADIEAATPHLAAFFQALHDVFLSRNSALTVRLHSAAAAAADGVPTAQDPELDTARRDMLAALARVMRATERLSDALRADPAAALPARADFAQDIAAVTCAIREFREQTAFVLDAAAEGYVFWVEAVPRRPGEARAFAAPIQIGRLLADQLYGQRSSIVFSSATLTVRDSYDFLKKRLGLDQLPAERLTELNVGTPFDYRRQCAVLVPMFLPEPNAANDAYAAELGSLLAEVFRRTRGRGMVLFTSYAMLRQTTDVLRTTLEPEGTLLLAQGESGSRENITELFRRDVGSVLMGTHSFWEGVDVIGETLSCLVVARLPFAVHTDPIVQARCEQIEAEGGSAFVDYSVPSAVIKFRQGFGRLIRHRTDRGVVLVTDRRILSKRYGNWFRRSIPARTISFADRARFLDAIQQFMEAGA